MKNDSETTNEAIKTSFDNLKFAQESLTVFNQIKIVAKRLILATDLKPNYVTFFHKRHKTKTIEKYHNNVIRLIDLSWVVHVNGLIVYTLNYQPFLYFPFITSNPSP